MATITSSTGLGSGLNISSIVTALVNADKAPKQTQITNQTNKATASLSAISQLKSALDTFNTTLTTLNSTTTPAFLGFTATSSSETLVKATANNSAVSGSYTVKVDNLATSSKVTTAVLNASQASAISSGTLTITQNGTDYTVNIGSTSTLQQVRDTINSTLQTQGITANIINDGSGSRLVFGSTTTGAGSDITVKGDSAIGTLLDIDGTQIMSGTGAGSIGALAKDAAFSIDGLSLTSSTNTVTTAVSGLTLNLVGASSTSSSTITVATNSDGLKTSAQSFVDGYNTLVKLFTTLTKGTTATDGTYTAAALTGDPTARNILSAIRAQIATSTSISGLGSLAQLGITTQRADGTLALDSTAFSAALNDKKLAGQVESLFTGDTGLLKRISSTIEPFTKSGGILAQRTASLGKIQTQLAADQEALNRRIDTLTTALNAKYNAMDLAVGQLKATATSITSIFEAMNAQKSSS